MKKKLTLILLTCIACMALIGCIALTACKDPVVTTHAITWNVDQHVTVKVDGYDNLPEEVAEGTEIAFTVTPDSGYEITSIAPSSIKKDGDKYKFTVSDKDVTVTIRASRSIDGITATLKDTSKVYYAGDEITIDDITVTVKYKSGDPEVVTSGISIIYQTEGGDALALGDTEVTVSYRGHKDKITIDKVKALVTLSLNGGYFPEEELAKLPSNKVVDGDKITWTFEEAYAADYVLPTPKLLLDKDDPTSGLPFDRWSGTGVTDNKILAGTATSVVAGALYTTELVNVKSMMFTSEGNVPYLVIKGEFVAATSVFLYLYEGNAFAEYNPNITVTKQDGNNNFELKLNLADLAKAAPVYKGEKEKPENFPTSFEDLWLDIRFCVVLGETTIMQELFLTEGSDFANLGDQVVARVDQNYYRFYFESWTPKAGDPIMGGNGAVFTGKEKILKLNYKKTDPFSVETVTLENREDKPYLVLQGKYLSTKEEAQALLTNFFKDIQNFSNWSPVDITDKEKLTVNDDGTFEITLCLDNIKDEGFYIMHTNNYGDFNPKNYDKNAEITIGPRTYKLGDEDFHGWKWTWAGIWFTDTSIPKIEYNTQPELKVEGDKLLYVIHGTYVNHTKESLEALVINFDLQINGGSWERKKGFEAKLEVNEADSTFTVTIDITSLINNELKYVTHFGLNVEATDSPADFKPNVESFEKFVAFNGYKVTMTYVKGGDGGENFFGAVGLTLKEYDPNVMEIITKSVKLEAGEDGIAYLVFSGTWGYGIEHTYNEETDLATLKSRFSEYSVQNDIGGAYLNGASNADKKAENTIFVIGDGTFEVKIALNGAENGSYWYVHYNHEGRGGGDVYNSNQEVVNTPVTVNGQKFSFYDTAGSDKYPEGHASWLAWRLLIEVTASTGTEPEGPGGDDDVTHTVEATDVDFGGEEQFTSDWRYWTGGPTVSECKTYTDDHEITITYSATGGAHWAVQLFYKDKYVGVKHDVSFILVSPVAGAVKVNDQRFEIVEGNNTIIVTGWSGASTITMQFGDPTSDKVITGTNLKFVLKKIQITAPEVTAELVAPSFSVTEKVITITDETNGSNVGRYELGFFANENDEKPAFIVAVTSGNEIDLSTVNTGTYTVKLRAVNDSNLIVNSGWSTDKATITVENSKTLVTTSKPGDDAWYYWNGEGAYISEGGSVYIEDGTIHVEGLVNPTTITTYGFQLKYDSSKTITSYTITVRANNAGCVGVNLGNKDLELTQVDGQDYYEVTDTIECNGTGFILCMGTNQQSFGNGSKNLSGNIMVTIQFTYAD